MEKQTTITHEAFLDDYLPIKNHLNSHAAFDGLLFETYGEELEFIRSQSTANIWTLVEGGGNSMTVISGFHRVNRQGYFLTQNPVEENGFIEAPV